MVGLEGLALFLDLQSVMVIINVHESDWDWQLRYFVR